ncbi:hypothetical protein JCM10207_008418 [Rhodosporidiobolus poonsookiae]
MSKLIITGATGTAGSEVVRQALLNPAISHVTVLSRRPLPAHIAPSPPNPKLNVVLHSDFGSYPPSLLDQLKGHDACVWALGKSSMGMKEDEYERLTVGYAVEAARAFAGLKGDRAKDDKFVFVYLSGEGAEQREGKAMQMFGRVKGKAEHQLAEMPSTVPSLATYSFRPGGISPLHPAPGRPWWHSPVLGVLKVVYPSGVIGADTLARGMIDVALRGGSGTVEGWEGKGKAGNEGAFSNVEIKRLEKGESAQGV